MTKQKGKNSKKMATEDLSDSKKQDAAAAATGITGQTDRQTDISLHQLKRTATDANKQ